MTTVAVIPARGGSERLPGKNFKSLLGKSLLARAVDLALAVPLATYITTDVPVEAAKHIPPTAKVIVRPDGLSAPSTTMEEVLLHTAEQLSLQHGDRLLLLQPTSPLRTIHSLRDFLSSVEQAEAGTESAFSVTEDLGDYWFREADGKSIRIRNMLPAPFRARRSQDRLPILRENGLYYLVSVGFLKQTGHIVGETSLPVPTPVSEDLDVNDAQDWATAELSLRAIRHLGPSRTRE